MLISTCGVPHREIRESSDAMTRVRRALGAWGERTAEAYLGRGGVTVIDRNWRTRDGEIDLIALDGDTVVFCEVKTRRTTAFGSGIEGVTARKSQRLRRLAAAWLADHGSTSRRVRFDVVSVTPVRRGEPRIDHVKGAF
jgi:putative endonuclease